MLHIACITPFIKSKNKILFLQNLDRLAIYELKHTWHKVANSVYCRRSELKIMKNQLTKETKQILCTLSTRYILNWLINRVVTICSIFTACKQFGRCMWWITHTHTTTTTTTTTNTSFAIRTILVTDKAWQSIAVQRACSLFLKAKLSICKDEGSIQNKNNEKLH